MSEIYCPKCGKGNPDGALICQFCDSPLVTFQPRDPNDHSPLTAEPILPTEPEQSIPVWLAAIRDRKLEGKPAEPNPGEIQNSEQEKADLDSWLAQLRGGAADLAPSEQDPAPGEETPAVEGETTPTWLASIREKISTETGVEEEPEISTPGGDWLSNLRKQTEELSLPPESDSVSLEPAERIDDRIDLDSRLENGENTPVAPFVQEEDSSPIMDIDPVRLVDDNPAEELVEESDLPNGVEFIDDGSLPPSSELYEDSDEPHEKITTKDLPDWLSSFMGVGEGENIPESALLSGLEPEQANVSNIEPGTVPTWVKAMRPVESIKPDSLAQKELDRRFEDSGPLAGIRGILPGSEMEFDYSQPVNKDNRETSLTSITLFENTLQVETEEQKLPVFKRSTTSNIVRWLIAAVLFLIIILIQAGGNPPDLLPRNLPLETISFFKSISSLPQGSSILLVLDYDPAYSGEMEAAANAPISLMMNKQTNLFTLSTSPTNLFLADNLVKSVVANHPTGNETYADNERYHVLGYLPGGQSGMQGLLLDFKSSLPVGLDLKRTTELSGLNGIITLNDFDAIMILTDNPDTARTWVEQVKPGLTKPAIWMAVSSQAVALVRPYARAGQIDGLISGVYGAASFEQIIQKPGAAANVWNSYYTALILAMVIIITGGFVNYIGFSLLRAKMKRENPS